MTPPKKWTEDHKVKALDLLSQGLTKKATAKQLGVSESCLAYNLDPDAKAKNRAKMQRFRENNPEYNAKACGEYYENNREARIAATTNYNKENSEQRRSYHRGYMASRREKVQVHLKDLLSGRLAKAIKHQYGEKAFSTTDLLGCSIEDVRDHLESQFSEGMTWENMGRNGWHIDHIRPCDSFDLTDPEEQQKCFHYTNLQPLWQADNIRKSNHYITK